MLSLYIATWNYWEDLPKVSSQQCTDSSHQIVKSLRVQSRALNVHLLVTGVSSTTMALVSWVTLQGEVPLLRLQTGICIAFKSSGILKVLCKVRPPVKSVAAILLDAV